MTRKGDKGDQPSGGETTYLGKYWSDVHDLVKCKTNLVASPMWPIGNPEMFSTVYDGNVSIWFEKTN